jgi:alkylated DNA nucleotide flippase Atl1
VARRAGSILNWLRIQDASRKRQDSSQTPGAWAGCVVRVNADGVFVLSDEDKWRKAKLLLKEVMDLVEENLVSVPRKRLKQVRGFLVYVTRTYP